MSMQFFLTLRLYPTVKPSMCTSRLRLYRMSTGLYCMCEHDVGHTRVNLAHARVTEPLGRQPSSNIATMHYRTLVI